MNILPKEPFYLLPTSSGCYHCMSSRRDDPASTLIRILLGFSQQPHIQYKTIAEWLKMEEEKIKELLRHMLKIEWLMINEGVEQVQSGKFEDILPDMILPLSSNNKTLLADSQGFYIASAGFPHETAEELSALSADLASLFDRHEGLLQGNLNYGSGNWSIVDAAGFSQLGFWPLHVSNESFYLIVDGVPHFEKPEFMQLGWVLHTRYAANKVALNQGQLTHRPSQVANLHHLGH